MLVTKIEMIIIIKVKSVVWNNLYNPKNLKERPGKEIPCGQATPWDRTERPTKIMKNKTQFYFFSTFILQLKVC